LMAEILAATSLFLILLGVLGMLFATLLLVRNNRVHRHMMGLVDQVSLLASEDIAAGRPWAWRYTVISAIDYTKMVHHFWKPFNSFYDKDVLKKGETK
jgi:hypothetical protein